MKVTFFNGSTSTSVTTAPQVIAGSVDPALVQTLVIDATAPLAGAVDALAARVAALEGGVTPPAPVAPTFTTQPSLIGSTALGSTITVSLGAASGTPTPTLTGTLTRPGKAAAAVADGATFQIEEADQGGTITLDVTATNGAGSATASATLAVPVAPVAPTFTAQPSLSGSTALGDTITVSLGTANGTLAGTLVRPGRAAQVVADGTVFTIQPEDQGSTITLTVRATNANGSTTATAELGVPSSTGGVPFPAIAGDYLHYRQEEASASGLTAAHGLPQGMTAVGTPVSVDIDSADYVNGAVSSFDWQKTTPWPADAAFSIWVLAGNRPVDKHAFYNGPATYAGNNAASLSFLSDGKVLAASSVASWALPAFTGPETISYHRPAGSGTPLSAFRMRHNGVDLGAPTGTNLSTRATSAAGARFVIGSRPNPVIGYSGLYWRDVVIKVGADFTPSEIAALEAYAKDRIGKVEIAPQAPAPVVQSPGLMTSWANPTFPSWQEPSGWSSTDAQWGNVALFSDFRRSLGLDQGENGLSINYVPEKVPTFDANGAVFDGSNGFVTTSSAALGMGDVDATVDLFGIVPSGLVARVTDAAGVVNWSVSHNGSAWVVAVHDGGLQTVHTITDPLPTAPVDLALVRQAGALRFYRDGALLYTATAGAWSGAVDSLLIVAGNVAPFAALRIAGVRITSGVARYSGDYTPAFPAVTSAKTAGGALRVAYGSSTTHTDPAIVPLGDKLVFGLTTLELLVEDYDPVTHQSRMKAVGRWDERNAHNNPAFCVLPDGHMVYVGSGHSTSLPQYRGITATPFDAMSVNKADLALPGVSKTTYVNLWRLEGEPGEPIYLLGRQGGNNSTYQSYMARTYDRGTTWEVIGNFFGAVGNRPYIKMAKTSPTRLDFFSTYTHPDQNNPGLVHLYYEGGHFYDSVGTRIGSMTKLPIDIYKGTRVFDGMVDPANSWSSHIDRIGNKLCCVATVNNYLNNGNPGHYGYYLRAIYDLDAPGTWQVEYVCDAGGAAEAPYSYPNIGLDLENPDRAFASVKLPGIDYQIVELNRVSEGNWQVTRRITNTPAGVKNLRPRTILSPMGKFLTWMDGDYVTYANFRASARLLRLP